MSRMFKMGVGSWVKNMIVNFTRSFEFYSAVNTLLKAQGA